MRKTGLIIFAYALAAFAVCLAVSFIFQNIPELLSGAKTNYLVVRGLIFFLKILPSLVLCGFIVGCSISYGKDCEKAKIKYSRVVLVHFRKTMVVSIIFVLILTLAIEILLPAFESKQKIEEQKPSAFTEFLTLANECYQNRKMEQAYEYSSNAVKINPKDEKARWFREHSETELKSMKGVEDNNEEQKFVYVPLEESSGETVYSLLQKAKKAESDEDWFNAHYYAYSAVSISDARDINLSEAKRLASEAWNHLFDPKVFEENEEQALFRKKRDAYLSLINGDNVEAYYQFLEISKANDLASRDPDVVEFLKIAEERVSRQCFFIEETENLKQFETSKNVFFALTHDDGAKDVFFIEGITPVKNSGKMVQYLRSFEMISFDKNGQFKMSLSVPYAKMLSVKTSTFDDNTKTEFDIKDDFKNVPFLMLEGISRDGRKDRISPVYEFDAEIKKNPDELKNYFVLGLSTNDFNSLCDAEIGSGRMNLFSLMKLIPKAHDFGFSREIFNSDFLNRVTYPLFMLLTFMFAACLAWNFRLSSQLFKFRWIFALPFISAAIFAVLELVLYALKLLIFVLVSFTGNFAVLISFAILVLLLFVTCFAFVRKTA